MKEHKKRNSFIEGAISPLFIADSISKHHTKTSVGAHSIFLGQVRADVIENKTVKAIEYTAYNEMAEEKIAEIREAIFAKYSLTCMHIHHSLGMVNVGEICFFVFTSSSHRNDATLACNELVERIKKEVPIWGKEIMEDDTFIWKENK
jgi:molybdopterin synthase catalytic subunit